MQDKNTRSVIVVWCTLSLGVACLLMTGHAVPRVEAADPLGSNTRLATYDTATGDTFFALSLVPQVEVPAVRACDVIVLFDTSASQTGAYRTESLEVLQAALGQLHEDSRVRLYAIDLLPMSMNDALVAATDPAILPTSAWRGRASTLSVVVWPFELVGPQVRVARRFSISVFLLPCNISPTPRIAAVIETNTSPEINRVPIIMRYLLERGGMHR